MPPVQPQPFNVRLNVTKTGTGDNNSRERPEQMYNVPLSHKPQISVQPVEEQYNEPFNVKRNTQSVPTALPKQPEREPQEKPYTFIRSELLDDIADYLQDNYRTTEMFQYPNKYWYGTDLEKVKWVSVRFRCVIENMICLDRQQVERGTLVALNNALEELIKAWNFRWLPYNYPLKNEIIARQKALARIVKVCSKKVRVYTPHTMKVKLIALRFQLADLVPFIGYHKLNFSK